MLRVRKIASCGAKTETDDIHRSLRSLTPESPALKGRRLQSLRGFSTGDSGLPEVRHKRHGFAQKFAPNWFHKMLETHIAKIKSSHREALAKSSNPLNLGKTRWEEEENTRRLHGKASKPEEEVS
jgi:hypothetical protein